MTNLQTKVDELYAKIQAGFRTVGYPEPLAAPDHLSYRAASWEEYGSLKTFFASLGELLIETPIRGRPIATYRLRTPLSFGPYFVRIIEVPAPKPGQTPGSGFDHCEYVVPGPLESFRDAHPVLRAQAELRNHAVNAELILELGDVLVKFHTASLEDVIANEKMALVRDGARGTS